MINRTTRLRPSDVGLAKRVFKLMAAVFDEESDELSDAFVERLLARQEFWVIAAFSGDDLVGGLTAHTLPMTRSQSFELFIYDIAVRADQQRRGIGRQLISKLREEGAVLGVHDAFVLADDEDAHALDFYRALDGKPSPVTMFSFAR